MDFLVNKNTEIMEAHLVEFEKSTVVRSKKNRASNRGGSAKEELPGWGGDGGIGSR